MVKKVRNVYQKLSADEKKKVVIIAQNYGEAGAIDYYGEQFNLPEVYSLHNSYWMWGPPTNWDGNIAIVIGLNKEYNSKFFEEIELAATHHDDFGMPYENVGIFICRRIKMPVENVWEKIKVFI